MADESDETKKPTVKDLLSTHGAPVHRPVETEPPKKGIYRRNLLAGSALATVLTGLGLGGLYLARQEPRRTYPNPFEELEQLILDGKDNQIFRKALEIYLISAGNGSLWGSLSDAEGNLKREEHHFEKSPERKNVIYQFMESSQDPHRPFIRIDIIFNTATNKLEVNTATVSLKDLGLLDANFSIGRTSANQTYQLLNPLLVNCPSAEDWSPGNATQGGLQSIRAANKVENLTGAEGSRQWKREFELTSDGFLTVRGYDPKIPPYVV